MNYLKKINSRNFLFLIISLIPITLISLKTFEKVDVQHIRISGSELFTQYDLVNNSSLKFPIRLISIETKFLEKELKQNLSLKNISVDRQIFPFGLKVQIQTRIPIAYGEKIINNKKILGYIDQDGVFINKQNTDEKDLNNLKIKVFGWKKNFKEILSEIFIAQDNYEFEVIEISFSPNGFLTVREKDLNKILLGFNPNLINYQLQIINNLKENSQNNFPKKIDNIDLTDPNKPKIKVFKP